MSAVEYSIGSDTLSSSFAMPQTKIRKEPSVDVLTEISKFTFTSKYSRFREDLKRRETWTEAVSRVEDMHLRKFAHLDEKYLNEIRRAFDFVRAQRVVPSMRSMQFGGAGVEAHNPRIYNCAVRHLDSLRSFAEIFYLLLCGCGMGVGLSKTFVNKLPELISPLYGQGEPYIYTVGDTIEGWADSLEVLLKSYTNGNELSGKRVQFDYSAIRPEGTPLRTGGGKAPGPFGLKKAHDEIRHLLDDLVKHNVTKIKTIVAYDILMFAAEAVLSGGVRRSATCVIFDRDDEDMMNAKVGNWLELNPQRTNSNNSVLLIRDKVSEEDLKDIIEKTKQWGEPGFVFANDRNTLYNPCFEVSFVPITDSGKTGVQFCNLTSINGSKVKTEEDFYECAKAATIIGTLQASYTEFPYLSPEAKELTTQESLLGVSIVDMLENNEVLLDPTRQQKAAKIVVDTNKEWADIVGINPAARCTVVKPDGTCSLALGTMSSGIHPAHARKMFRRIKMNKLEAPYQFFKMFNPELCGPVLGNPNGKDEFVTFPIELGENVTVKSELNAIEHLELIKSTQLNWVLPGTTDTNKKDATHNVSCTVLVKDNEWDTVANYLFENRKLFSAVSLLSVLGDKMFTQPPMEAVTTFEDEALWDHLRRNMQPVDYTLLQEDDDLTSLMQEMSCAGGRCEL